MIFYLENHRIPSHYDLHIKNFNSDELKFLIEYQYKNVYVNRQTGFELPLKIEDESAG